MNSIALKLLFIGLTIVITGCAHHPHYYSNYPARSYQEPYYGERIGSYYDSYHVPPPHYHNAPPQWHGESTINHHENDRRGHAHNEQHQQHENYHHERSENYQRRFRDH